jgi:GNAT superfamily N-acetyltransferase
MSPSLDDEKAATMSRIKIRRGTVADLPAIAQVLVDTWRTTFGGVLPDPFLQAMSYEQQEERHRRTMGRPESIYFAATAEPDGVVAFASGGPSRSPEYPYPNELYAVYIRQQYQARGIGRRLLTAVSDQFIGSGRPAMIVWVLAVNPFRPFYERLGARPIDKQKIVLGTTEVEQIAYAWADLRLIGTPSSLTGKCIER